MVRDYTLVHSPDIIVTLFLQQGVGELNTFPSVTLWSREAMAWIIHGYFLGYPYPIHATSVSMAQLHGYPPSGPQTSTIPSFCMVLRSVQFYVHRILVKLAWGKENHCSHDQGQHAEHFSVILVVVHVVTLVKNHTNTIKNEILMVLVSKKMQLCTRRGTVGI
jgi:hypothetical protein